MLPPAIIHHAEPAIFGLYIWAQKRRNFRINRYTSIVILNLRSSLQISVNTYAPDIESCVINAIPLGNPSLYNMRSKETVKGCVN